MKILIFGTGDYYNKYKKWIREENVVALIDNDREKQGTVHDRHPIIGPDEIARMEYDYIIILSVHVVEMIRQLSELGVDRNKVIKYSDIYKHPEFCTGEKSIQIYGKSDAVVQSVIERNNRTILLMSHNLDLNGASMALFYMAKILKYMHYNVVFASWNDGELREYLDRENIPVIVDCNLEIKSAKDISWIHNFEKIICNTVNFYQFLSERCVSQKFIWWLHDPVLFYESLDTELLYKISKDNLKICAAGRIAEQAMSHYRPDLEINQLLYGIEDVGLSQSEENKKLEVLTVSNIQRYKGQDLLIDMLELLDEDVLKRIHMRIVGSQDSQFANELKERAKKYKDVVEFVPPVNREKVDEMLNRTDIYICPSRVDSMSMAAGEAMQHGIPCIVSDAAGISSYIEDGISGFTFRSGHTEELAGKLLKLIENKQLVEELGSGSRKIYEDYFSMEVFSKNLSDIVHFFD